jgi:hypothetical protein
MKKIPIRRRCSRQLVGSFELIAFMVSVWFINTLASPILADQPYRTEPRPAVSQASYLGESGPVTQVSFVDDKTASNDSLHWRRRPKFSTPVPTNSARSRSMNKPRRSADVLADIKTNETDEIGIRWNTNPRDQQLQSTRPPLDPFKDSLTTAKPRSRVPLQTIAVQTQSIARPIFSGNMAPQETADDTYNNRDCAANADRCRDGRERLANLTVSSIDLDITPMLNDLNKIQGGEAAPERRLPGDSRNWKDRAGRIITTGVFIDFTNGRLQIKTDTGEVVVVPIRDLSDDDRCYFSAWWGIPIECDLGDEAYAVRNWMPMTMTWKASANCHNPLYFEEVQLERYGHTAGPLMQPVVSGAHFFFNIAVLPYKMGIHPWNECMYPLGSYREGDCAPWLVPPIPFSLKGGLMEAGAIVGGVYILP